MTNTLKIMTVGETHQDQDGNLWEIVRRWPERVHNYTILPEDFAAQLSTQSIGNCLTTQVGQNTAKQDW